LIQVTLAALLAIACAILAIAVSGGHRTRILVPVSGGLLAAIAVFAIVPETAGDIGWIAALLLACVGYGLLHIFDRVGIPVCPSCSHSHGFSIPLVIATAIHAFVDGWGMMAFSGGPHEPLRIIVLALLLHKIPEGLALGAILRMSEQKPARAIALVTLAEGPTLLGGLAGLQLAQAAWLDYPLALVAGAYLFLGIHAIRAWVRPVHTHDHDLHKHDLHRHTGHIESK
jgi:ZIP family zinc transporter/zinc and cadmium transporter